jgi:CheY-like chemotaxis protein
MTSEACHERRDTALIVDDDGRGRAVLRHLLELAGWTVYEAADGREGLRAYERRSPDLVITDIDMPVMDGVEMAARIRCLPGSVPVLAVTRSALEGQVRDVFDQVVRKPVSPRDLQAWLSTR